MNRLAMKIYASYAGNFGWARTVEEDINKPVTPGGAAHRKGVTQKSGVENPQKSPGNEGTAHGNNAKSNMARRKEEHEATVRTGNGT